MAPVRLQLYCFYFVGGTLICLFFVALCVGGHCILHTVWITIGTILGFLYQDKYARTLVPY